jgi:hypothetical protein
MKYFIPLILTLIFSCNAGDNKKQQTPNTPAQDSAQILQTANGDAINLIGGYTVTDTSNDYILFPLLVRDAKNKDESVSLYSKERGDGTMYWNIIFHNYKTGENSLLEPEKKILIGGYNLNSGYYSSESYSVGEVETYKQSPYIFYTVYTDDYNGDKKLGTNDPAYFYISNPDGSGFKQVSPPNISITQKTFPKNTPFLLLSGIRDSNNDKKFDADDEQVYYKVNMTDSAFKAEEIFNTSFKIKLKKLFDKNWKN